MAMELQCYLLSRDYEVLLTRIDDTGVILKPTTKTENLERICRTANDFDADIFISIHCNSWKDSKVRGFEIFTSKGQTKADELATRIFCSVSAAFPKWPTRSDYADGDPDKEDNLFVLNNTSMPAVLIECGFITNPEDVKQLESCPFRTGLVFSIFNGIHQYGLR